MSRDSPSLKKTKESLIQKLSNSDFDDLLCSLELDSPVKKIEPDHNIIKNFSCRSIDEAISKKHIEKRSKFKTIKILVISNFQGLLLLNFWIC